MQRSIKASCRDPGLRPTLREAAISRRAVITAITASLAWGRGTPAATPPQRAVGIGEALQDGVLIGLNGPSRRLSDFHGHPLLINVWASWCGPCREEMSSLERLAWHGDARAFNIIGISTDDDPVAARRLLASTNATLSHFIDHRLFWETMLGASRLPLTVLADARGHVLDRVVGAQQWDGPAAARRIDDAFGRASAR
jgi:thiol-disulfide isomerase/thioredoxin